MTSTRVYGYSSYSFPEFVMPVDLAMHAQTNPPVSHLLGLSRPSPLNLPSHELQLTGPSTPSPTSSLSSFSSSSSISSYSPIRGTLRRKKRVVFADAKGLALTSVRIFTVDRSETETEELTQPEDKTVVTVRPSTPSGRTRVKLGFPQPVADRASLKENLVQLESCSVTEKMLSGSVRVCNVKFDKSVFVRITFDSWRSHQDIACTYVREPQSALETDLFAFNISLPSELDPKERVEFLVVFKPGKSSMQQFVDNNRGKNYHLSVESMAPEPQSQLQPQPHPQPLRLFTPSRRSFVVPSPQRLSVWSALRGPDLHRTKYQPCKRPPYTERLLHKSWGSMTNLTGLC